MTHLYAQDALPLYVLGLLDAVERETLELHLRHCAECQGHLAEERLAVASLGHLPTQVRPRTDLKARVMRATQAATAAPAFPSASSANTSPDAPSGRAATARATYVALAAAALLALATTIGMVRARSEIATLREELARWRSRTAAADDRATRVSAELSTQRQAISLLTASDLVQATLNGVPPTGTVRARALLSSAQKAVIISAQDLPPPPPGRTYQLWVVAGSQAISVGTFATDAGGSGQLISAIPALPAAPAAIAVTLEPDGGSPQPTGPKVLVGVPGD